MSDREHNEFIGRLRGSHPAVFIIAEWLHAKGYAISIPRRREAPTRAQAAQYADEGDLFVMRSDDGDLECIEVKGLSTQFTCEHWPFRDCFLVNRAERIDHYGDAIPDHYILSQDRRTVGVVRAKTRPLWFAETKFNAVTQRVENYYACAPALVEFMPVELRG
jgi:hypothetical protein